MTPTHRIALGLLAALAAAGPAGAEQPCAADARRFCAGKAPLELLSCLQAHRPDLAPACVARVEKVLVFFQQVRSDCEPDAFEHCRGTAPGLPTVECLQGRQGKLTPRCQEFFDRVRARDAAVQQACGDEAARPCAGVTPGLGGLWMCLGLGAAEVSQACAAAL